MQLYTSLIRLKQAMNGGALPVMTPLTAKARRHFDTAFLIDPKCGGMGGLQAHPQSTALRCPLRGCGRFFHQLTDHLDGAHGPRVNARAVKELLEIPNTVPLISARLSEKLSAANRRRVAQDPEGYERWMRRGIAGVRAQETSAHQQRIARRSKSVRSVGFRNLRNSCPAQVAHQLIDLRHRVGREVTMGDVKLRLGATIATRIESVFGSLGAATAYSDLISGSHRTKQAVTRDRVMVCLGQWYMVHGRLPSLREATTRVQAPLLPDPALVLRALGTDDWDAAMAAVSVEMGFEVAA